MPRGAPSDEPSTHELIEKAREGDQVAFERLVERHERRLFIHVEMLMSPMLRAERDPEDVLQDVYVKLFRALSKFQWEGQKAFEKWLDTLTERTVQDLARSVRAAKRDGRRLERLNGNDVSPTVVRGRPQAPSPSGRLRRDERFQRLKEALGQLSAGHRKVILLRVIRRLPARVVAEEMGRSEDAVAMLLQRALRRLEKLMGLTDSHSLPDRSLDPLADEEAGEPAAPASERDRADENADSEHG